MEVFNIIPADRKFPSKFVLENMAFYATHEEMIQVLEYLNLWKKISQRHIPHEADLVEQELIEGNDMFSRNLKFILLTLTYEVNGE